MSDDGDMFDDIAECNRAYVVVEEVLDDIIDAASEVLYDNYVLAKVRNVALDHVMDEIAVALRSINVPHDVGECGMVWMPDEDPECAPIDTWGRGAVPRKTKKKPDSFLSDIRAGESSTPSVGSRARSRRSGRSRRSSRSNFKGSSSSNHDDAAAAKPTIILAASSSPRPSTLPKARAKRGGIGGVGGAGTETKSDELNALERIQQEEQARIEQLRQEQEEEDARYKALQNELKGKEYTFDADGNLIVIARIAAEKTGGLAHITAADRFGVLEGLPGGGDDIALSPDDIPAAVAGSNQHDTTGGRSSSSSSSRRRSSSKTGKSKKGSSSKRRQGLSLIHI